MSKENVEVVQRANEALNEALSGETVVDQTAGFFAPEVVIEMGVVEGTWRGYDGVRRFVEGQAVVEGMRCDPDEYIDAGERVVVPFRLHGRARETRLPIDFRYVHVLTMRDGKIVHLRLYGSKGKALEAVGLSE